MKIQKKFQGTIPENKILDTHSTSKTDTYSCNYVNSKINNDMLRAVLSANTTIPAKTYTTIPFSSKIENINGNGSLSLSNGVVTIINENVRKVRVYVQVLDNAWGSNSLYLTILRNGVVVKRLYTRTACTAYLDGEFIVNKGDTIETQFYSSGTSNIVLSNDQNYTQLIVSVA